MALIAKTLREIRQLTAVNDHGGALLIAAKALGCEEFAERLQRIQRQHLRLGYLPPYLYEERHGIYTELMTFAKKHLTPVEYQKFHRAF